MNRKTYRQSQPTRSVHPRILILCEGQTEEVYFNSLKKEFRHTGVEIPRSKFNTAKQLVGQAIEMQKKAKREENPYDDVFVVVDHDPQAKLHESFDQARQANITLIYSNPCFELWYLLHFIPYSTAAFNHCDDVNKQLRRHIPDYHKGRDYSSILNSNRNTAIQNAEKMSVSWERHGDGRIYDYNPYCCVFLVVKRLGE